jgi:prepilin-type N-terminal cleavage/methylation domain-containing protein
MPIVINGKAYTSRGFTLVEMSIVLVIIGLIIGGILKGQEIIASARQKAVINQFNAVRAAANTYFDRYRALPGDDPAGTSVDGSLINGDGSGIVGTTFTSATNLESSTAASTENYEFFNGLVAANLLNGAHVTSGTIPAGASLQFGITALPAAPITGAGLTVAYGTHAGAGGAATRSTHWLRLHKNTGTPTAAISARTLANIDTQTDDGQPGNGGVRSTSSATCNTTSTAYLPSDDLGCVALFEITQ